MVGSLQAPLGLQRALKRPPIQSPILFRYPPRCVFGQLGKEKWSMWFEVIT